MESKTSKQSAFNPNEILEIKGPVWAFWVCLLAMIGCLVTFFVFLFLKTQNTITLDTFYFGYIFLVLSLLSAVGVYAWFMKSLPIQAVFINIITLSAKIDAPLLKKSARLKF